MVGAIYSYFAWGQWAAIGRQADIAERALTAEKIPYVYVSEVEIPVWVVSGETRTIQIKYKFKNYGGGPAFLRSVISQTQINERLGPKPHATPLEPFYSSGHIIGGREETPLLEACPHNTTMSVDDFRVLERKPGMKLKIFFFGLVNYLDVWGKEWTTGFAWVYDASKRAMRVATKDEVPDDYNYRREEQSKSEKSPRSWWPRLIPARFYRLTPK